LFVFLLNLVIERLDFGSVYAIKLGYFIFVSINFVFKSIGLVIKNTSRGGFFSDKLFNFVSFGLICVLEGNYFVLEFAQMVFMEALEFVQLSLMNSGQIVLHIDLLMLRYFFKFNELDFEFIDFPLEKADSVLVVTSVFVKLNLHRFAIKTKSINQVFQLDIFFFNDFQISCMCSFQPIDFLHVMSVQSAP
jgi:hypothetical protein